ncbi:hypothetical protein ABH911_002152 [Pseudomonas protegens]|uniref:hypothetical protein n=1 Tax=Pseudomonas protegens TaxID=380021 RepID=UPI0035177A34
MLVAVTATAATPEVIALARASMAGCSEALPAGLVAGGAAKLTAEQLSDVRALMELQKQTGIQVSSEALSVALGKTTGKPDAPTLAGKWGSIDGLSTSEKTLGGAGGDWKVIDEVVDPSVVKQVNSLSCGQACVEMMLGDRKINASKSVISKLAGDGETYETQLASVLNKLDSSGSRNWVGSGVDADDIGTFHGLSSNRGMGCSALGKR